MFYSLVFIPGGYNETKCTRKYTFWSTRNHYIRAFFFSVRLMFIGKNAIRKWEYHDQTYPLLLATERVHLDDHKMVSIMSRSWNAIHKCEYRNQTCTCKSSTVCISLWSQHIPQLINIISFLDRFKRPPWGKLQKLIRYLQRLSACMSMITKCPVVTKWKVPIADADEWVKSWNAIHKCEYRDQTCSIPQATGGLHLSLITTHAAAHQYFIFRDRF